MPIEKWSDTVYVANLADDPQYSDDLAAIARAIEENPDCDVVLNFAGVTMLNSSNLGALLRLRKRVLASDRHLVLCGAPDAVWSVFLGTGLDRIFTFETEISSALARVQLTA